MHSQHRTAGSLTAKFIDHLPYYRQEQQFKRLGIELARTLMCRWAMQVASACQPLFNQLQDELQDSDYINIDEITVQVVKEPGPDPTTKSYMWLFRRGDPHRQVLLYQYHPTRSGDVVRDDLGDFKGYVQTDGYAGDDFLDHRKDIQHIGCLVHARRTFADIVKAQGKKAKPGSAHKGVAFFSKLYKKKKMCRDEHLPPEEIYQRNQKHSKPILDDLKSWLEKKIEQVPTKTAVDPIDWTA
ncbi:MAG: hypothetical protein CSA33_06000 [Desulfobulbus propionicus]|nr:MAG: hypothetical protein CSA33_06000 [Desulfobulbus propionicus]